MLGEGACVIDVGCDHGYLPAKLLSDGKYSRAVASDIAPGPLGSAKENIGAAGVADRCSFCLTDGLSGIEPPRGDFAVSVCGMGGEMICSILSSNEEIIKACRLFVLQPMSKEERLRAWLWENGFHIVAERAAAEGDRLYVVLAAVFCKEREEYTAAECYLGKREARVDSAEMTRRLEKFHAKHRNLRHEIAKSGGDATLHDELVRAAEREIMYIREKK
jgi:tRNA (adenine22-N1)-methyltransferase